MGILEKIFGRKKRPSNINGALEDMSHMLTQYKEDPTFGVEILHGLSLDFSIDSLVNINGYLDIVRERQNEISPGDLQKVVLRAGAYVGEVLRKHSSSRKYDWYDFNGACTLVPQIAQFGRNLATAAVLVDENGGVVFPMGKVGKYIENGSEDDLQFYAQVLISQDGAVADGTASN